MHGWILILLLLFTSKLTFSIKSSKPQKGLWAILSDAHKVLTSEHFDYRFVRSQYHLDLASIKCNKTYETTLIYLNSVVNYSIWRHRNDIRYRFINFDLETLSRKIVCSIGARKARDPYVVESYKVPFINKLHDAILCAVNHFPFDNG